VPPFAQPMCNVYLRACTLIQKNRDLIQRGRGERRRCVMYVDHRSTIERYISGTYSCHIRLIHTDHRIIPQYFTSSAHTASPSATGSRLRENRNHYNWSRPPPGFCPPVVPTLNHCALRYIHSYPLISSYRHSEDN
jgi:hypothetical protein